MNAEEIKVSAKDRDHSYAPPWQQFPLWNCSALVRTNHKNTVIWLVAQSAETDIIFIDIVETWKTLVKEAGWVSVDVINEPVFSMDRRVPSPVTMLSLHVYGVWSERLVRSLVIWCEALESTTQVSGVYWWVAVLACGGLKSGRALPRIGGRDDQVDERTRLH